MFVPITDIRIVKKTDSVTTDAIYTLQLYKLRWRGKAEKVVAEPIRVGTRNPLREVIAREGQEPVEAEEERLIRRFSSKLFFMVYPGDTFREVFKKAASDRNEWLEKHEAKKAEALKLARANQRTVLIGQP